MKNKKNKRKSFVVSIVLLFSLLGISSYFISNYIENNCIDSVVKNNKSLYIGCPLSVNSTDGSSYGVEIDIGFHSVESSYVNSWSTADNYSEFIQDDNYPNIGWLDLTSTFSNFSGGEDIDVFCSSSEENYITLYSVWLGMDLITSESVTIDESGLWFINVAEEDGGEVEVLHSYVYNTNTWNLAYLPLKGVN